MSKTIAWLVIATVVASAASACAEPETVSEPPSVSIGSPRTVSASDGSGALKEFTVTVGQPAGGEDARSFVVRGPDDAIDPDEQPSAQVVGERLLVLTRSLVVVFDLASGQQVIYRVAAPEVVVSADGRWVAFKTLQLPFTPAAASSSVIQVLQVPTLEVGPVFPESWLIEPSQFGYPLAWIEEPADRHFAGQLYFSPDGSRLLFFCTHEGAPGTGQTVYLAVIDLAQGVAGSRFLHRPFDWKAHLRTGAATGGQEPFFAVGSVRWEGDGTLVVKPPPYARWLEEDITIPLPGPGDWASDAGAAQEER